MKTNRAFTLIELLVVISVIAILVALLVPWHVGNLGHSRAADCANNLRSLGQGMVQYLSDTKGMMFPRNAAEPWPKILHRSYVKDWKCFRSPFDKPTSARPKRVEDPVPISYGLSDKLFDTFEDRWKSSSSSLILMAPVIDVAVPGKEVAFLPSAISTTNVSVSSTGSSTNLGTHGNRELVNVLFADTHVEAMEWKKFSDTSTEKGKAQWDPMY